MKKDILLIMSDQHNGQYVSMKQNQSLTPWLNEFASEHAYFRNAYCNAPLCVPSRTSFLTGKYPCETKVFDNDSLLASDEITLAHKLGLEGYETILIGRMHFKGHDQFHGFDKRYVGDITTQFWGQQREDLGTYHVGFKAKSCQELVDYGESPVLDFDRAVLDKTLEILNKKAEKPRFILVGFYAPHFPYISNNQPMFQSMITPEMMSESADCAYLDYQQETSIDKVRKIDETYQQMIYEIDQYCQVIYQHYQQNPNKGVFIYTSDHGDMVGRKSIFGKKVMYQDSIQIPMVIEGLYQQGIYSCAYDLCRLHHDLVQYSKDNKQLLVDSDYISRIQQIVEKENQPLWTEALIQNQDKIVLYDQKLQSYHLNDMGEEIQVNRHSHLINALTNKQEREQCLEHYQYRKNQNILLTQWGRIKALNSESKFQVENQFVYKKKDGSNNE